MKEVSKIVFNNSILKADLNGATLAYQCNWRKIKGEFYSLLLPALYWSIIDSLFGKTSSSSALLYSVGYQDVDVKLYQKCMKMIKVKVHLGGQP